MVMSVWPGMADAALRERLPALWRRIEDAHYSYLETEDSPEKLEQRKKLEGYILEYLSLVPHECKFGLAETGKVFTRTVAELPEYTACRAGLGWAALARYAANLLVQPWRVEYKTLRLYSGFYKHEVEANMVGAESLLSALGYRAAGAGRVALSQPVCPDMVAAMSRDAIIAQTECQIMSTVWESVWAGGGRVSWAEVYAERAARPGGPRDTAKALQERCRRRDAGQESNGSEIYSNIPVPVMEMQYGNSGHGYAFSPLEEPIAAVMPQYVMPAPNVLPPHMMYPTTHHMPEAAMPTVPQIPQVTVPQMVMTPYGVPYYYPVQAPYMVPAPAYAPIKHATTVPLNGYPTLQYRYPIVPTGQLIELDSPYENGKEDRHRRRESRRNSTSKSGFSDVSLPSLPRSDTQPALSKAREDGMGTYESWDYVFRNLSSKDEENERSRYSPSLERDSRTLDRLDREERRVKYQPTTLDLEDGLQALNLDRSYDEDLYRTAKVNENLMRLKQEQEQKKARQLRRAARDAEARRRVEPVPHPKADALIPTKVAPDKVKLLTKKDIKDRKDVIKQTVNGATPAPSAADARKVKKPAKLVADDRPRQENGHSAQTSKATSAGPTSSPQPNHELKAQLVVSLDEPDTRRPSSRQNGERDEKPSDTHEVSKWHCATCTYLNRGSQQACEMCGKSKRGPEIQPLTSGGRECPACTLVNQREARACDACGTSLQHCPTYI